MNEEVRNSGKGLERSMNRSVVEHGALRRVAPRAAAQRADTPHESCTK